jgi:hypothetical protein
MERCPLFWSRPVRRAVYGPVEAKARSSFATPPDRRYCPAPEIQLVSGRQTMRLFRRGKPALSADHRRALTLLASSADGVTEALMLVHGFRRGLVADLDGRRPRDCRPAVERST